MNKIYLGTEAIVDLSGYYGKAQIDASYGVIDTSLKAFDASIKDHESQLDSITDTISDLDASMGAIFTKVANDYYTKTYIDSSIAELDQKIDAVVGVDLVVVDTLPTASADTLRKIYLIPSANPKTLNSKDEFITVDKGAEADARYAWEQIGSTEVDLSNYYNKSEVDQKVADASQLALDVSAHLDTSVRDIWTEIATLAKKSAVDASIAVLDASVSALESEVKIYGNTSITNLITCTSTAYAGLTKDPSTLYIVTD